MIKNPYYYYFLQQKTKRTNSQMVHINQWVTKMIAEWSFKASTEKQVIAKCREKFSQ